MFVKSFGKEILVGWSSLFVRHINRFNITRFLITIWRRRAANIYHVISLNPHTPQTLVESASIQVPDSETSGDIRPREIVVSVFHSDIKQVNLVLGVRDEVFGICARCYGMIKKFRLTAWREGTK